MRDEICGVGALAVANSYGFLLKRLTLSLVWVPYLSPLCEKWFQLKLVRRT